MLTSRSGRKRNVWKSRKNGNGSRPKKKGCNGNAIARKEMPGKFEPSETRARRVKSIGRRLDARPTDESTTGAEEGMGETSVLTPGAIRAGRRKLFADFVS